MDVPLDPAVKFLVLKGFRIGITTGAEAGYKQFGLTDLAGDTEAVNRFETSFSRV
jgi:hypothetical protein